MDIVGAAKNDEWGYDMAKLTLHGGCVYSNVMLDNTVLTEDYKQNLINFPIQNPDWNENAVLRAQFNNDISGSNFEGDFQNVKSFEICKVVSQQPELHKVCSVNSNSQRIIEDFIVGNRCGYVYYIFPIIETTVNGVAVKLMNKAIQSEPIFINDEIIRVFGLIQDAEDASTYRIDYNNVWHLGYNVSNSGFQNNMSKTFNDTLDTYPVEVKGQGNHRTFSISGLLGKYDCNSHQYIDTYDDIIEWEQFMNNDDVKAVIDLRGVVHLGSFAGNSFQYAEQGNRMISVNVDFKQLRDMNDVTILGRQLLYDGDYQVLCTSDNQALVSSQNELLLVQGDMSYE